MRVLLYRARHVSAGRVGPHHPGSGKTSAQAVLTPLSQDQTLLLDQSQTLPLLRDELLRVSTKASNTAFHLSDPHDQCE